MVGTINSKEEMASLITIPSRIRTPVTVDITVQDMNTNKGSILIGDARIVFRMGVILHWQMQSRVLGVQLVVLHGKSTMSNRHSLRIISLIRQSHGVMVMTPLSSSSGTGFSSSQLALQEGLHKR